METFPRNLQWSIVNAEVTIKDVAAAAGVSVATASRVLSGHKSTSDFSRKAVFRAAAELDYSPNQVARSLRSARSRVIGVLVSDIRNPYFGELAHSIQQALAAAGYATILGNASEDAAEQEKFLSHVGQQRVDGLILVVQSHNSPLLDAALSRGLPVVFVDRTAPGYRVPTVDSESHSGIKQALEHLESLGHKRVGMLCGPADSSTGSSRKEAFDELAPLHFSFAKSVISALTDPVTATKSLLDEAVSALLFAYTPDLWQALEYLRDTGIEIPADLSVIAYDDLPILRHMNPPFTTIRQEVETMGKQAVTSLLELLSGGKPADVRLPTKLLIRKSTAQAADHQLREGK